jgi:hypothetical protein
MPRKTARGFETVPSSQPTAAKKKPTGTAASVKYTRDELNDLLLQYYLIRDCIEGEPAIKGYRGTSGLGGAYNGGGSGTFSIVPSKARLYLPMPNAHDQSPENIERYNAYVQRAVFYNVAARTLDGMVGQVYLIDPVYTLPKTLEDIILEDADGQSLSLIQLSKRAVRYTAAFGRSGILTDYPPTDEPTSKKALADGDIRPIITVYPAWNIRNWRMKKRGVKTVLSMLVLREESTDLAADGFKINKTEKYRHLYLDDSGPTDVYTVELHCCDGDGNTTDVDKFIPKDSKGKTFDTIPFTFIGSENNDAALDKPPLYDLCSVNIAHYRNSADYEESCYQCGQPTVVAIGLTEDWYKNVLKGQLSLGSRGGIPLPAGSSLDLVQAKENSMPFEAMKQKEDQMVAIGAKLVIQKRVQKTATEAIVDVSSEQSVLTNVADNVSTAFVFALKYAARFIGAAEDKITFVLNTEFELNRMTLDDISKLIAVWQKGAISFDEMRDAVRKSGLATLSNEDAKKAIGEEVALGLATGPVADPFGQLDAAAAAVAGDGGGKPNPNSDPAGHATQKSTRNTGK